MSRTVDRQDGESAARDPRAGAGATVILAPGGDREFVRTWLESRGLRVVPMLQGFQVVAPLETLDAVLRPGTSGSVPRELIPHVKAIQPTEPKYIHP